MNPLLNLGKQTQPPLQPSIVPPITAAPKKINKRIPVLIGVFIAGLAITILLGRGGLTKAGDTKPLNVTATPNSASSVTIRWSTGSPTVGQVIYSTNMDSFVTSASSANSTQPTPNYAPEEGDTKTDHSVTIEGLQANTTYYYQIQVGDSRYDQDGVPYSFATPATDGSVAVTGSPKPRTTITNPFTTSVTPVQHLEIPNSSGSTKTVCNYTSCDQIKAHFGQGCSTSDYIACLKK